MRYGHGLDAGASRRCDQPAGRHRPCVVERRGLGRMLVQRPEQLVSWSKVRTTIRRRTMRRGSAMPASRSYR
ncbi:hypothetical protein [Streptomyces sp. CAU 1734]|uniref:hypothetical protein n=1 Tax=Streptomyces sp. CAU 1734 TaxID=3140360 RepID=UPI003261D28C